MPQGDLDAIRAVVVGSAAPLRHPAAAARLPSVVGFVVLSQGSVGAWAAHVLLARADVLQYLQLDRTQTAALPSAKAASMTRS